MLCSLEFRLLACLLSLFCHIIVPIMTYAAEMWILNDQDIDKLDKMHRYAGRRLQRLNCRSAINTSYECLMFNDNIGEGVKNVHQSPIFDILRISIIYGLYEEVCRQICGTFVYTKQAWKKIVCDRAWLIERESWNNVSLLFNNSRLLCRVMEEPGYSVWWQLSDVDYKYVKYCEVMIKIICRASRLRSDDYMLEGAQFSERTCTRCNDFVYEDVKHLVLQCEANIRERTELFDQIARMPYGVGDRIVESSTDLLATLLGQFCAGIDIEYMFDFWKISCVYVSRMYWEAINERNRGK